MCLLDVQTEAAASGGHVPGDPRQVECAMLQHVCSQLLKISGRCLSFMACWGPCGACGARGTHPGDFMSATSCMARVVLGRCCTAAVVPGHLTIHECIPEFHQGPSVRLALSIATRLTPKTPQIPQQISVPFVFQSLLLACLDSKKPQFR